MTTSNKPELVKAAKRRGAWPVRAGLALLAAVAIVVVYRTFGGGEAPVTRGTTFKAVKGDLEITVVEGGSIEARESQQLKSEVQGVTKILYIVEEGYLVTPQDVAEGKVLVELDSKDLLDRLTEQELQYQNALASFTEAREEYGIQINQNQSDVKTAELASKFALMDLKKFLGDATATDIARRVVENVAASDLAAAAGSEREPDPESGDAEEIREAVAAVIRDPETGKIAMESTVAETAPIDYGNIARLESLGDGEARQAMRKLEDDVVLAEEDVGLAESRLSGTQRLFEKDFVTKIDLENDQLALKRKSINMESAKTDMDLYVKYEFPKQAEKLVSDYEESLRKLQRARKLAVSKLAQAEAKLNSAQARFELQSRKRTELTEQVEKCVIRATRPGLVVYGEGNRSYYRDNDRIEEGAQIRERQVIITIPDTTQMTVDVKVHESYVKRVMRGQKARVTVDAFPDIKLTGEVLRIAVLPDSQNRWMNPDLKVYSTSILIDGHHEWLKPGMSAEAQIVIDVLKDVVQVPLQAVFQEGRESVVYVADGGLKRRVVETGSFDTTYIEIKSGLEPGEIVALRAPNAPKSGDANDKNPETIISPPGEAAPAAEAT